MHKPPRRMHTSTRRFPLSRRSPSRRRAFLGVFSITKSFGRHDKCQRPRISLQIKRCQPITPPIIRRKHREIPIFRPRPVCRGLRLQNTRKNARRHHPPTWREPKQKRGLKGRAPSLIQIYIARNGSTEVTQARGRAGKAGCPRAGHTRQLTRRCKPSCAYPRQHRTGYQSGSREASSSRGRSRCSQPGRSRSHRHHRPCCRSRPPGR